MQLKVDSYGIASRDKWYSRPALLDCCYSPLWSKCPWLSVTSPTSNWWSLLTSWWIQSMGPWPCIPIPIHCWSAPPLRMSHYKITLVASTATKYWSHALITIVRVPAAEEMHKNMTSFLDPSIKPPTLLASLGKIPGNILMFDGVALESKCCYCPCRDCVIGLCWEHSKNFNPRVTSFAAIGKMRTALFEKEDNDKKVCFGSDATVVAMASYAQSDHYWLVS